MSHARQPDRVKVNPVTVDGWNFASASEAARYEGLKAFAGRVMTTALSPEGRTLVCTWGEGTAPKRTQAFQLIRQPLSRRRGVGWKPRTPEKQVQAQVVHLLRSVGGSVYIIGTKRPGSDFQGTCQTPGIPDLYVFLPQPKLTAVNGVIARCAWIEVKAEGGKLSTDQEKFSDWCHLAAVAHVVGGVNEVAAFLVQGGWLKAESIAHYRRAEEPGSLGSAGPRG